jgi:branched-chain amino acid transport system permease protein
MEQITLFLQQLLNGISLGSIYALIALGYTMVYGVLRFINFAHGDIYMLGAFSGFLVAPLVTRFIPLQQYDTFTPQNFLTIACGAGLVMLTSMAICAIIGVLIEKIAYRPLRN